MSDDLSCSVCKRVFHEIYCVPKYLNCHHTFCWKCLQTLRVRNSDSNSHLTYICPLCHHATTTLEAHVLLTNHYILKLLESKKENERLAEISSKWCSTCSRMAKISCKDDHHLLVELDKKRKAFPCTKTLEDLMVQQVKKYGIIIEKRKKFGKYLEKARDHWDLVMKELRYCIDSNEERCGHISQMMAPRLSCQVISTNNISKQEQRYHRSLRDSTAEIAGLKNILKKAETIDGWKKHVDHYNVELMKAFDKEEDFCEESTFLFQLLHDLVAPIEPSAHNCYNPSQEPSQLRNFVSVLCEDDFGPNSLEEDATPGDSISDADSSNDSEESEAKANAATNVSDNLTVEHSIVNRCAWSCHAGIFGMFAFAVQADSDSKVFILHHDWVDAKCQLSRFEIVDKVSVGPESVVSLAWDASGLTIAIATSKGRLLLWNKDNRKILKLPGHDSCITHLKWNYLGNNAYLLTASEKQINVWDSATLDPIDSYPGLFDGLVPESLTRDVANPDKSLADISTLSSAVEWISSKSFVVCVKGGKIVIHCVGAERSTALLTLSVLSCVQFVEVRPLLSPNEGKLRITTLLGGTCTSSDKLVCGSARICFSDKPLAVFNNIIASVRGDCILLYDTDTDMPIKFLDVGDKIESCCFSADGSRLAVVYTFTSSLEGSVSIFCTKTWQPIARHKFQDQFNTTYSLHWNFSGDKIAVLCDRDDAIPDVLFFAI